MRRREFIAFVGGTAAAWPLAARAQKSGKVPIIGFLGATTPSVWSAFVDAFLQRLRELGRIDGSTVAIEYRWAQGRDELYSEFAAEFVRLKVDVIVTAGTDATMFPLQLAGRSRCCSAALIFNRFFFCRLPARQPFWKTKYAITILRQLGSPIEGLWQFRRLASAQGLYSPVQVAQQVIHSVGDFSGNPYE